MLVRNCAGGIIFSGEKVFLLKNQNNEWILPKAVIRRNEVPSEVALNRIKDEAGIDVDVVSNSVRMSYDFHYMKEKYPICNKIMWYIMRSKDYMDKPEFNKNLRKGDFFTIDEAIDKITCNHDKSIVNLSFKMLKDEIC